MYSRTLTVFLLLFWSSRSCSAILTPQDHACKFLFNQSVGTGYFYRLTFKQAKDYFEQADEQALKIDLVIPRRFLITFISVLLIAISLVYLNFINKQKVNLLLNKKNRQLDMLNEQLMAANQAKAKLFGIISHDLRSPVSQLFTFLRLQQNHPGVLSEACKDQCQQELLLSSSNLLVAMEDLLLWSKSQMDHFTLNNEDVDITHLLAELMRLQQAEVKGKKLKLEIEKPDYQFVYSDYNLLFTILRNLLQNAVRHAFSETVISICAKLNAQQQPYLSIINHGEMIPAERLEKLINDVDINSKSSGYGLLIVKDLSTMIGAQLNICSTPEGTTAELIFS